MRSRVIDKGIIGFYSLKSSANRYLSRIIWKLIDRAAESNFNP